MTQQTTTLAAAAVAIATVGFVAAKSYRAVNPEMAPKLVWQRLGKAPAPSAPSGYVAGKPVAPRPEVESVLIRLLPPPNRPLRDSDGEAVPVGYRVTDASGRVYASVVDQGQGPVDIVVPRSYGRPVEHPRVEVHADGVFRGSIDLPAFPKPEIRPLVARKDPRLRAFYAAGPFSSSPTTGSSICFQSLAKIPTDEVWDLELLQTNLALEPGFDDKPSHRPANGVLLRGLDSQADQCNYAAAYPEDLSTVRVRVVRFRRRMQSEDVAVSAPLRTASDEKPIFKLEKPLRVKSHLGFDLFLENSGDGADPYLLVDTNGPSPSTGVPNSLALVDQGEGPGKRLPEIFVKLHGSSELGLFGSYLQPKPRGSNVAAPGGAGFGGPGLPQGRPETPHLGKRKTVILRLGLSKTTWERLQTFEVTIPVEGPAGKK